MQSRLGIAEHAVGGGRLGRAGARSPTKLDPMPRLRLERPPFHCATWVRATPAGKGAVEQARALASGAGARPEKRRVIDCSAYARHCCMPSAAAATLSRDAVSACTDAAKKAGAPGQN